MSDYGTMTQYASSGDIVIDAPAPQSLELTPESVQPTYLSPDMAISEITVETVEDETSGEPT